MKATTRFLGLAALAAGAFALPRYFGALRAARERLRGASEIADTTCGPIEYAQDGRGFPLLVVHGAGGGFDQGMSLGRAFAQRGFHVVAMSRFGYLRTPIPVAASPAAQADAHAALLDALGIARAAIMGVSAGGPSALEFAIRHPGRCAGLILLAPLVHRPAGVAPSAPAIGPFAARLLDGLVGSDFAFWLAKSLARDQLVERVLGTPAALFHAASVPEQARVLRMLDEILPIGPRAAGLANDARVANALAPAALGDVRAPTLVLSARDDGYGTFAGAEYTAGQIRDARFVGIESGGHVWVGHHVELLAEIEAFLRTLTRPAPAADVESVRAAR